MISILYITLMPIYLRSILILSFQPGLGCPKCFLFLVGVSANLYFPHLNLLNLNMIILGEF